MDQNDLSNKNELNEPGPAEAPKECAPEETVEPEETGEKREKKEETGKKRSGRKDGKSRSYNPDAGSEPFFKDRKNLLRLILLILAVAIAITSISLGVFYMTNKEPGYYEIELSLDSAVPGYNHFLHLEYYFSGSSNEIKAANKQLTEEFTAAAKRTYQRLDSVRTYIGVDSVATVNESAGKAVRVDAELLDVLSDAYERTKSADGYNMFAGILYGFWDSLLYNYDPVPSDPLMNADQAELLAEIEGYVNDLSGFTFEIDREKGTVLFDYSDGLKKLMEDYGFDWPVLDLNLLHDAYRLDMLKAELERKGWTNGRLYTDDGLSVVLSGNSGAALYLYTQKENAAYGVRTAYVNAGAGCSGALFRTFPFYEGEDGFYAFSDGEKNVYRSKYHTSPAEAGLVESVLTVSDSMSLVELCCANIAAMRCGSLEDLRTALAPLDEKAVLLVSLRGSDYDTAIFTNALTSVAFDSESGILPAELFS